MELNIKQYCNTKIFHYILGNIYNTFEKENSIIISKSFSASLKTFTNRLMLLCLVVIGTDLNGLKILCIIT